MCPAFVLFVAFWLSAFNFDYIVFGEDSSGLLPSQTLSLNCTICEPPCHPLPPPSLPSGYPSYGAPPPPPPPPASFPGYPSYRAPPPPSTYPSYGAPPPPSTYPSYGAPPPPSRPGQANCPPVPVQCCQYPTHPNPDEYLPLDDHSPTPYLSLSAFSIVITAILTCCFILA